MTNKILRSEKAKTLIREGNRRRAPKLIKVKKEEDVLVLDYIQLGHISGHRVHSSQVYQDLIRKGQK
jgi:hypothetical protein